ncbi:MAG: glycoside hydrolase N-terminal domain-containing protein [Clostridia bacterium]|nr:glycoside hydrolase N-terminal domain-containing protein [Clostridia bacterium]
MLDKKIINCYPAVCWREATPIGNGRLGACIYGNVYDDRILINHESLYNGANNSEIPDISSKLQELRGIMDRGEYKLADSLYPDALNQAGYNAIKGSFYPAFDLHSIYQTSGRFEGYSRTLDMSTGVCSVAYEENGNKAIRTAFVSHAENALILRVEKSALFTATFAIEMHDLTDHVDYNGNSLPLNEVFESQSFDRYIYASCISNQGLEYSGIVKILDTDGSLICNGRHKTLKIDMKGECDLRNYIKVTDASYVVLALKVVPGIKERGQLVEEIDKIKKDYAAIECEHKKYFSEIFNRVLLNLCDDENTCNEQLILNSYNGKVDVRLIEKMADFGRYLFISSAYNCSLPANLQGVWNGDYSPAWGCTFFNNENIQMEYWQAFGGDVSEACLPLFDLYDRFKDDYRQNAKKLYGCRGILLPLFMDNQSGKKDNLQPHVLYWTGSSAWISAIYFDYYVYTRDEKFLLERAYPFMKEAALFYEDFLVIGEDGKLKSYPSNSPENRADGSFEGKKELSVSINATMDFALVKELLCNLLLAVDKLNLKEEKKKKWMEMLSLMPEYQINEDGAMREWLHDDFKDNYHHRHQSHIYPLFPGNEITRETNYELFKAIEIAVDKRLSVGLKEQTGWSFAHMANIFARLGNGNKACECLENIIRFCTGPNLFAYHNDWRNMGVTLKFMVAKQAPFQVDANMGFTAAVYEMLMYSNNNMIKLLPALPKQLKSGCIKGIVARGGFIVDISWSETVAEAFITAKEDREIAVGINNGVIAECNAEYSSSKFGNNFINIKFKKGETVKFKFNRM